MISLFRRLRSGGPFAILVAALAAVAAGARAQGKAHVQGKVSALQAQVDGFLAGAADIRVDKESLGTRPYRDGCTLKVAEGQGELVLADLRYDFPALQAGADASVASFWFPPSRLALSFNLGATGATAAEMSQAFTTLAQQCWQQAVEARGAGGETPPGPDLEQRPMPGWAAYVGDGRQSLAIRLHLIRNAQASIWYKTFEFYGDEAGQLLAEALIAKKQQRPAMDIRIFIDAYPLWGQVGGRLLENSRRMFGNLLAAGILVAGVSVHGRSQIFHEMFEDAAGVRNLNFRYHEKSLVVDALRSGPTAAALIGGINTANPYFRIGTEKWSDVDTLLQGSLVTAIGSSFLEDWQAYQLNHEKICSKLNPHPVGSESYQRFLEAHHTPYLPPHGSAATLSHRIAVAELAKLTQAQGRGYIDTLRLHAINGAFIKSAPRRGERFRANKIEQLYVSRINSAKREIIFGNLYFIPPRPVLKALQAALARGVDIKGLANSMQTNDQHGTVRLSRFYYAALARPLFAKQHPPLWQQQRRVQDSSLSAPPGLEALAGLGRGRLAIFEYGEDYSRPVEVSESETDDEEQAAVPPLGRRQRLRRKLQGLRTGMALFHAKYLIIDRKEVINGSFNLDARSRNYSREHVVWLDSPGLATDFVAGFHKSLITSSQIPYELMLRFRKPAGTWEQMKLLFDRALKSQY